jgi:Big-like domain-containing protein
MPFLFKLSQRVGRTRCVAVLFSTVAFAACEQPAASGVSGPVVPGTQVAQVVVSPATITLLPFQTKQFTAFGRTQAGDSVPVAVTWSASAGSVSASGLYTADAAGGSATVTATGKGHSGAATVSVTAGPVTYYRTNFTDGTTGPLDVYAYGGGFCGPSTDYRDPGSAASIKCTVPAISAGAAALQAWFGNGRLANLPKDPSLDQDLFEEVRFVLAPGAITATLGGQVCTALNPNSQVKVHKSVYGQAGNAWNGWAMTDFAPCKFQGMITEPEMWNQAGAYDIGRMWPSTYPTLQEGVVFDVIYRYHRYTAQGCGTVALWVNGTKVMDSPCESYIGTTQGSTQGLLFWDGAVYLQEGLGAYSVYNLFSQATNYPVGAATASP